MRVLSLFDGISCGRLALERAGFEVERYVAYEIDKHAITVSRSNWPDIEHRGSVVGADFREFAGFDMVIGGSPCQGFSFSGKQLNFDDPRSVLFFEFERAVREVRPEFFLLENVRMVKASKDVISDFMGCDPHDFNSALVSAQNRKRLYWTNIPGVEAPEDRGIYLRDIIEDGAVCDRDKSLAITASYINCGHNPEQYLGRKAHQMVLSPASITGRRLNERGVRDDYNKDVDIVQCLQVRKDRNKIGCLTTVYKDNVLSWLPHGRYLNAYDMPDGIWRMLTPVECERAQTLPDGYTAAVSKTQRYKGCGNGWTVDMIAHIFNYMRLA